MSGSTKKNTAWVICSVLIFKLLFVNIGIISALHARQNKTSAIKHFSGIMKRRRSAEVFNDSKNCEYQAVEICEEAPNEDSQFKSNPFLFVHVFFSLFADSLTNSLKKVLPFNSHLSYTESERYLTFQVFRI